MNDPDHTRALASMATELAEAILLLDDASFLCQDVQASDAVIVAAQQLRARGFCISDGQLRHVNDIDAGRVMVIELPDLDAHDYIVVIDEHFDLGMALRTNGTGVLRDVDQAWLSGQVADGRRVDFDDLPSACRRTIAVQVFDIDHGTT